MKIVSAVGLMLFNFNSELLLLRELEAKVHYCKKAGMLSFPIETIEKGETPNQALDRLIDEEIGMPIMAAPFLYKKFKIKLNGSFTEKLHVFIGVCRSEFVAYPKDIDVEYYGWMLPRDFLNLPKLPEPFREQIRVEMPKVLWDYLAH